MSKGRTPDDKELESVKRKIGLVLNVSGQRDEQINVLVHSLAKLGVRHQLEMTTVISALCEAYLRYLEAAIREQEGENEDE